METLTVKLKVVTPLFLGGAEPDKKAELRAPSIKGALRYWYRAIDPDYQRHEARIFGGTGKEEGQARFLLRVVNIKEPKKKDKDDGKAHDARWHGTQIAYLGYGPINRAKTGKRFKTKDGKEREEQKSMTLRPYICSGTEFSLSFCFKPQTSPEDIARVKKALWALVMLGGLGARCRKGFGSLVAIESIAGMAGLPTMQPKDKKELAASFTEFLNKLSRPPGLPEYTSWSDEARCVVAGEGASGEEALKWVGSQMHACRSWRSDEKQRWVTDDHHLMRNFIGNGMKPQKPPLRAAFGLPHNYFFTSLGDKKGGVDYMDGDKSGRRASPLIIHIHEFDTDSGNNKACVVATYLPARLIPKDEKVRISGHGQVDLPIPDDFTAVTDFIERLGTKGKEIKL